MSGAEPPNQVDRREFLRSGSHAAAGAWLLRALPFMAAAQACADEAERTAAGFTVFTEREAADFDALAARILPTDETPGAREAGVVRFADQALDGFFAELLPIVRQGLADLDDRVGRSGPFAELDTTTQDEHVGRTETEDPGFFFFARTIVMAGMVSSARYGGNQNNVGWELIGFEPQYAYAPPFGYYDRNEHGPASSEGDR